MFNHFVSYSYTVVLKIYLENLYILRFCSDSTEQEDEFELTILPQMSYRCTKNDFGYKTTRSNIHNDNRVSFHGSLACFEGCIVSSSNIEVPVEYSPVPNIEQSYIHHTKPKVSSSERYVTNDLSHVCTWK